MKFAIDKAKNEIVINCFKKGMSIEDTSEIIGWTIENISEVIDKYLKKNDGEK